MIIVAAVIIVEHLMRLLLLLLVSHDLLEEESDLFLHFLLIHLMFDFHVRYFPFQLSYSVFIGLI